MSIFNPSVIEHRVHAAGRARRFLACAAVLSVAACGANAQSGAAERAEERAQQARQEARDARADAEKARREAFEAQGEKHQSLEAQREAEQRAAAADERAAQAEAQANRDGRGTPPPRAGVAERQPDGSLLFAPGSAELSADARANLDAVVGSIRARGPGHKIVVQGYSDASGDEAANVDLSQRRAEAVAGYIVGRGIPRDRIEAKGLGPRKPANREDTEHARAHDRRVEVLIQP